MRAEPAKLYTEGASRTEGALYAEPARLYTEPAKLYTRVQQSWLRMFMNPMFIIILVCIVFLYLYYIGIMFVLNGFKNYRKTITV